MAVLLVAFYDVRTAVATLLLMIVLKNLTVPPIIFILLYSVYKMTLIKEADTVLLIVALIIIFKFRYDLRDFLWETGRKLMFYTRLRKNWVLKRIINSIIFW